jgi:hypothetical protein
VGLERGSLSLVSTIEELHKRESSRSGLENGDYGRKEPPRRPHDTPLSAIVGYKVAYKRRSLGPHSSLADKSHEDIIIYGKLSKVVSSLLLGFILSRSMYLLVPYIPAASQVTEDGFERGWETCFNLIVYLNCWSITLKPTLVIPNNLFYITWRGSGSIPGTTRKKSSGSGLERGPLNLVSTTQELLDRKVGAPV